MRFPGSKLLSQELSTETTPFDSIIRHCEDVNLSGYMEITFGDAEGLILFYLGEEVREDELGNAPGMVERVFCIVRSGTEIHIPEKHHLFYLSSVNVSTTLSVHIFQLLDMSDVRTHGNPLVNDPVTTDLKVPGDLPKVPSPNEAALDGFLQGIKVGQQHPSMDIPAAKNYLEEAMEREGLK